VKLRASNERAGLGFLFLQGVAKSPRAVYTLAWLAGVSYTAIRTGKVIHAGGVWTQRPGGAR
jgi:hypothetical protein